MSLTHHRLSNIHYNQYSYLKYKRFIKTSKDFFKSHTKNKQKSPISIIIPKTLQKVSPRNPTPSKTPKNTQTTLHFNHLRLMKNHTMHQKLLDKQNFNKHFRTNSLKNLRNMITFNTQTMNMFYDGLKMDKKGRKLLKISIENLKKSKFSGHKRFKS